MSFTASGNAWSPLERRQHQASEPKKTWRFTGNADLAASPTQNFFLLYPRLAGHEPARQDEEVGIRENLTSSIGPLYPPPHPFTPGSGVSGYQERGRQMARRGPETACIHGADRPRWWEPPAWRNSRHCSVPLAIQGIRPTPVERQAGERGAEAEIIRPGRRAGADHDRHQHGWTRHRHHPRGNSDYMRPSKLRDGLLPRLVRRRRPPPPRSTCRGRLRRCFGSSPSGLPMPPARPAPSRPLPLAPSPTPPNNPVGAGKGNWSRPWCIRPSRWLEHRRPHRPGGRKAPTTRPIQTRCRQLITGAAEVHGVSRGGGNGCGRSGGLHVIGTDAMISRRVDKPKLRGPRRAAKGTGQHPLLPLAGRQTSAQSSVGSGGGLMNAFGWEEGTCRSESGHAHPLASREHRKRSRKTYYTTSAKQVRVRRSDEQPRRACMPERRRVLEGRELKLAGIGYGEAHHGRRPVERLRSNPTCPRRKLGLCPLVAKVQEFVYCWPIPP